jgi:serine/threonine protein kinase
VIAELVLAIGHMHSYDMVYRDLKPENVLFDMAGHIRLTDFGLAKVMNRDKSILRETVCGTPLYMSPEGVENHVFTRQQQQGAAIEPPVVLPGLANDWWMLGILSYELLLGATPFRGASDGSLDSLQESILTQELTFTPTLIESDDGGDDDNGDNNGGSGGVSEAVAVAPPQISDMAQDFVSRLLDKSPLTRLGAVSIAEVKAHAWFSSHWGPTAAAAAAPDSGGGGGSSGASTRSSSSSSSSSGGSGGGGGSGEKEKEKEEAAVVGSLDWGMLERKELPPLYVPAMTDPDDLLSHFPERSDSSFANDADLAFHAPARAGGGGGGGGGRGGGGGGGDPFGTVKKGTVNDFYFDRVAARAKAAERESMEAMFKQRAAAAAAGGVAGGASSSGGGSG